MNKGTVAILMTALLALSFTLACEGPEEKKLTFFEKGKAFYQDKDYVKARLELKNAVQIDPKFAQGYDYIGLVAMAERDYLGRPSATSRKRWSSIRTTSTRSWRWAGCTWRAGRRTRPSKRPSWC